MIKSKIGKVSGFGGKPEELDAPYGYCPECGKKGVSRERRTDGYDICSEGHKYLSTQALLPVASKIEVCLFEPTHVLSYNSIGNILQLWVCKETSKREWRRLKPLEYFKQISDYVEEE